MKPLKMNVVATKEVKISFVIRSTSFHFARPALPESARCQPTRCVSFLFRSNETLVLSPVIPQKTRTSDFFLASEPHQPSPNVLSQAFSASAQAWALSLSCLTTFRSSPSNGRSTGKLLVRPPPPFELRESFLLPHIPRSSNLRPHTTTRLTTLSFQRIQSTGGLTIMRSRWQMSILLDHLRLHHYHHRRNFFSFSRVTLQIGFFKRLGCCLFRVGSLIPSHADDLTRSLSPGLRILPEAQRTLQSLATFSTSTN